MKHNSCGFQRNMALKRIAFATVLVILLLLFAGWFCRDQLAWAGNVLLSALDNREEIRKFIQSQGPLAPLAFIGLQVLQVLFAPIPGEATGIIGGFLFGKWWGLIYSTIGLSIGSVIAFWIARRFRPFVKKWLQKSPVYWKFEKLLERQGLFICFFMYVFPGFPKDFLSYLLGLSRMPWQVFAVIATIGRIPGTMMLTWQGAAVYDGNLVGFVVMVLISLAVVIPSWIFRERIYAWVEKRTLKD